MTNEITLTHKRRQVRYWLFRMANEIAGGASVDDAPADIAAYFQAMPAFSFCGGFATFGSRWDISSESPYQIEPLEESLLATWDTYCEQVAAELPAEKKSPPVRAKRGARAKDVVYDYDTRTGELVKRNA